MISSLIQYFAQAGQTAISTVTNTNNSVLTAPVFTADFPESVQHTSADSAEKLGAFAVATFYRLGAKVIGKDFDGCRMEMGRDSRYELKTIATGDGIHLDTVCLRGKLKKAVVIAPGIGDRFESLHIPTSLLRHIYELIREALGDVTVMSLNVRGSGFSTGEYTAQRFHIDIYSVCQYLVHKKGFDPEEVYIYGESMGGCTGLRASCLMQRKYPDKKISAITDRSFLTLTQVVEERVPEDFREVAVETVRYVKFDVECHGAAKELKGTILAIGAYNDETVPFETFFGNQQQIQELPNCEVIHIQGEDSFPNPHARLFMSTEREDIGQALKKLTEREPTSY
ncbi:MAG: hypothetical protein JSR46_02305 [Verrucomicrobia bacterium]|nr:hypothetical protein [Verrucomicrobiota bacterium]